MPLLDSLLAFVVIVFAISMVVTVLVRIYLAITRRRRAQMKKMLCDYIETGLLPAVRRRFPGQKLDQLTPSEGRELPNFLAGAAETSTDGAGNALATQVQLLEIDTDIFEARLRASSYGKRLESFIRKADAAGQPGDGGGKADEIIDELFNDLAVRFEVFGERASDAYRRHARMASFLAGLALAFAFNADGLFLMRELLRDPVLRAAYASSESGLVGGLEKTRDSITSAVETMSKSAGALATTSEELNKAAEASRDSPDHEANELSVKIEVLEEEIMKLTTSVNDQKKSRDNQRASIDSAIAAVKINLGKKPGFEFGWEHFPSCDVKRQDERCNETNSDKLGSYISWFIGCIFVGLLAGLGAPFWHDMLKSVSQARQSVRAAKKA